MLPRRRRSRSVNNQQPRAKCPMDFEPLSQICLTSSQKKYSPQKMLLPSVAEEYFKLLPTGNQLLMIRSDS